jgi:hypothetical protein
VPPAAIYATHNMCCRDCHAVAWAHTPGLGPFFCVRRHAAFGTNPACAMRTAAELVNLLHVPTSGRDEEESNALLQKRTALLEELVVHAGLGPKLQEDITLYDHRLHACVLPAGGAQLQHQHFLLQHFPCGRSMLTGSSVLPSAATRSRALQTAHPTVPMQRGWCRTTTRACATASRWCYLQDAEGGRRTRSTRPAEHPEGLQSRMWSLRSTAA